MGRGGYGEAGLFRFLTRARTRTPNSSRSRTGMSELHSPAVINRGIKSIKGFEELVKQRSEHVGHFRLIRIGPQSISEFDFYVITLFTHPLPVTSLRFFPSFVNRIATISNSGSRNRNCISQSILSAPSISSITSQLPDPVLPLFLEISCVGHARLYCA